MINLIVTAVTHDQEEQRRAVGPMFWVSLARYTRCLLDPVGR